METLVAALVVSVVAAAALALAHYSRQGRVPPWSLLPLAAACGVGLVAMTLSDWPNEGLAAFWAAHSVLSATLSTLLLVGAGYLAFEARENHEQRTLTSSLASGAFGGCVDHMVDIDVALEYLRHDERPEQLGSGRPLRWLRELRDRLDDDDPRRQRQSHGALCDGAAWRRDLLDECVRRLMAAMRDWAPLLSQTRDGIAVLARIAGLRNRLLHLGAVVRDASSAAGEIDQLIAGLQRECRLLALALEVGSGVPLGCERTGVLGAAALRLDEDDAPLSFRLLLAGSRRDQMWTLDRERQQLLADFRSRFGREAPALTGRPLAPVDVRGTQASAEQS